MQLSRFVAKIKVSQQEEFMKYQHIKRICKNPIFVHLKKHYCPDCGELLNKTSVSKIVHSDSPEAADFDFQSVDRYMIGNVKFIWTEFQCAVCGKNYTIDQLKRTEKLRHRG